MKKTILFFLFQVQKILLVTSYAFFYFFVKKINSLWIVGVNEIAANIWNIGNILQPSITVSFYKNPFYNYKYDYSFSNQKIISKLLRAFYAPILLGLLANKSDNFFYIGNSGFLIDFFDGRHFEFAYLRKKGKVICCFFTGSDIRSPKLSLKHATQLGVEVMATYLDQVAPLFLTDAYENHKKLVATSADKYANIIFNAPVDQISYLTRNTYPFFYTFPDEGFIRQDQKFHDFSLAKILHAPSSPIIKGTQIVRAAIKKLTIEGYAFEYTELIGAPNEQVLSTLRDSHIVLNEFYAFVPGLFGIEAMAAHCALLTSGDPSIETSLPSDAAGAWMITKYWQIYDNLKYMLDHPEEVKLIADAGFEWAYKHWRYSVVKEQLQEILAQTVIRKP